MFNIAVIIGSLRKESYNKKLFAALDKLSHPALTFQVLQLHDLPMLNQDDENNLPHSVQTFKNAISHADGVLFLTPEYNRSIPAVLKNAIDWGTRPYGKNVWKQKPIAMLGMSIGSIGTAVAQSHLRTVMVGIDAIVLGHPEVYLVHHPEFFDAHGKIADDKTKQFLQGFIDTFGEWVQRQHA